jgi:4-hydroxy-3-polyprenylbenzoate decarboxylase
MTERREPILSLRSWIADVEADGELEHVDGAHWDKELGAIAELSYRSPRPKALLFDNIADHRRGLRVLTGTTGSPNRLGRTLRLGAGLDDAEVVARLRGRPAQWAAAAKDFPAVTVDQAPLLDNVVEGDDINLLDFPVPLWHELDGGQFIGTGCFVVTSDPETGAINGGCYRMQVQDEGTSVTISAVPGKHGAQNIEKWFELHGRAPVTVSFGHDPVLLVTGGTEVPGGISELDYAGAILSESVPVVEAPDTGLPIPAGSELAIEGWLTPDNVRDEGPFGEWTGYYSASPRPIVAMEITRLFHRDDPIILGAPPGKPPHDYSYMRTIMKSAMIEDALVASGVRGVQKSWAHESGGGRLLVAVSISQKYAGHARQVAHLTAQLPTVAYMNRFVVVVDDDVDVASLDEVMWAMCTRSDPGQDIDVLKRTWGSKLDPLLVPGETPHNSRAVIDACIPFERLSTFPKVSQSDPAYLAKVRDNWAHVLS